MEVGAENHEPLPARRNNCAAEKKDWADESRNSGQRERRRRGKRLSWSSKLRLKMRGYAVEVKWHAPPKERRLEPSHARRLEWQREGAVFECGICNGVQVSPIDSDCFVAEYGPDPLPFRRVPAQALPSSHAGFAANPSPKESNQMSEDFLKAHIENGRYVVDATTNLPDGYVVALKIVPDDGMSANELRRLH